MRHLQRQSKLKVSSFKVQQTSILYRIVGLFCEVYSFRSERWQNERLTNELFCEACRISRTAAYKTNIKTKQKANFPLERKFTLTE